MRHSAVSRRFDRPTAERRLLFRNLVTDLLAFDKIVTTEAKAKQVRGMAEKMITLGKAGDLHSRRQAMSFILDKGVTEKVFTVLSARYKDRRGGYTRIIKLGPRLGDGAPMVQLELIE